MTNKKTRVRGTTMGLYDFWKETDANRAAASGAQGQDARPRREELQEPVDVALAPGGEGGVSEDSPSSQGAGSSNAQPSTSQPANVVPSQEASATQSFPRLPKVAWPFKNLPYSRDVKAPEVREGDGRVPEESSSSQRAGSSQPAQRSVPVVPNAWGQPRPQSFGNAPAGGVSEGASCSQRPGSSQQPVGSASGAPAALRSSRVTSRVKMSYKRVPRKTRSGSWPSVTRGLTDPAWIELHKPLDSSQSSLRGSASGSTPGSGTLVKYEWGIANRFLKDGFKAYKADVLFKDILNLSKRPPEGSKGTKISLLTNHFKVNAHPKDILHYKVIGDFSRTFKEVYFKLIKNDPNLLLVYDGRSHVFVKSRHSQDVARLLNDAGVDVRKGPNKPEPHEIPYALDTILRHWHKLYNVIVGSGIYPMIPEEDEVDLGGGAVVYFGWHQTVQYGSLGELTFTVDQMHSMFYAPKNMLDVACVFLNVDRNGLANEMRKLESRSRFGKLIKGLEVTVPAAEDCDGRYEIRRVCVVTEESERSWMNQHGQLTHKKYWWLEIEELEYVPLELCQLAPGQRWRQKLSNVQREKCLVARLEKTNQLRSKVQSLSRLVNSDPIAFSFGVSIDEQMMRVDGRTLTAPTLLYGQEDPASPRSTVTPKNGQWKHMDDTCFYHPVKPVSCTWALAFFTWARNPTSYNGTLREKFVNPLRSMDSSGLKLGDCWINGWHPQTNPEEMFTYFKDNARNLKFILVLMPSKETSIIAGINILGDVKYGIPIVFLHVQDNFCTNVEAALGLEERKRTLCRINSKLGGINCAVNWDRSRMFGKEKVMFIGACTQHPFVHDPKNSPTIAAMVGSIDDLPASYASTVRAQKTLQDDFGDIESMMKALLTRFENRNNCKPHHIIMYRGGVSQYGMKSVVGKEMKDIEKAFGKVKITYIMVEKNHFTRFFRDCEDEKESLEVPIGTVVDTVITDPYYHDFYLYSSNNEQNRPIKYTVLRNDSKLSSDDLQQITYNLCYAHSNETNSLETPAPNHYAQMVCTRARYHLHGKFGTDEEMNEMIQIHDNLVENDVLYFL